MTPGAQKGITAAGLACNAIIFLYDGFAMYSKSPPPRDALDSDRALGPAVSWRQPQVSAANTGITANERANRITGSSSSRGKGRRANPPPLQFDLGDARRRLCRAPPDPVSNASNLHRYNAGAFQPPDASTTFAAASTTSSRQGRPTS